MTDCTRDNNYTYYNDDFTVLVTDCLDYGSSAAAIEAPPEKLSQIDNVDVARFGSGDYSSRFGYGWRISFVGNAVAGNVEPLGLIICSLLRSLTNDTLLTISTINEWGQTLKFS
jgi:hypothetical protein